MTINYRILSEMGRPRRILAAAFLAAIVAFPALIGPASAADQVQEGRTIEAFLGTNLVDIQGYPANASVAIDVLRKGVLVGTVTGTTDAEGFAEFNHAGGGQVSEGGDCFEPNATPDIQASDMIRTTVEGESVSDFATVRDVGINFDTIATDTRANTITVSGHVRSRANAEIAPGTDVLELRLNKGTRDNRWETGPGLDQERANRRDLRVDIGANLRPNGTFTRVLRVSHDDALDWKRNPGETALEWSAAAVGEEEALPPAIFVADEAGGEAIAGCPPLGEYAIKSSSRPAVNKAFVNGNANLVLSGVSFNASAVSVSLDDRNASTAPVVVAATPSQGSGAQTWSAAFTNAQVGALADGMLTAKAVYTVNEDVRGNAVSPAVEFSGANLRILKDTVAPARAPVASPRAGVYNRAISVSLSAQRGTTIHYTVSGARPTVKSAAFVRPIRVTGSQTLKAIAVDRAGNAGPMGIYRYIIR